MPTEPHPTNTPWTIRRPRALDDALISALAELTIDCVEGGASIGFMAPLTTEHAADFWRRTAHAVATNRRALLIAEDIHGLCGTVQLVLDLPDNQPHRADLAKMQVHRRARRLGLGLALLRAAEQMALDNARTLLVLDAVTDGPAARLYQQAGWLRVGDIPRFALMPDGAECSTTVFYKDLRPPPGS